MTTTRNVDGRLRPLPVGAVLALVALVALLAGCDGAAPIDAGKPRRQLDSSAPIEQTLHPPGTPDQRLLAFLHDRYGPKATLETAWKDRWDDREVEAERPVERRLCARQTVEVAGQPHYLLAVCQTIEQAASVEPGRIDLFVLRDGAVVPATGEVATPRPLLLIAQRLQVNSGSRGQPGTVTVDQLGPQRPAFRVVDGWYGQGFSLLTRTYVALQDNRLREVASYREHIDNLARYDCDADPAECEDSVFNIDFTTTPGGSDEVDGYRPIVVRGTGQDCTGPASEYYQLIFDPDQRAYPVPEALQREDCGTP